jgi:AtzE family amidohydrolase
MTPSRRRCLRDMIDPETSALDIAGAVAGGEVCAAAITEAALTRIEDLNPVLNAFTDITAARARKRAAAVDAARAAGERLGPLAGVPFAVKNLFDVAGLPTRAGSAINRELPPAGRDSPLIERLEGAGAVLVGALNMGEYAYDFTGENIHDGPSRNPHDPTRMTGGSSGGSGGAVAGRLVPIALGSDTNGSIRVPCSLCGVFGLKPTYGRLSRARSFPFVTSFDHLGPFARTVADLAASYDAMQGPDPDDPFARSGRRSPRCRSSSARPTGCASRSPAATSARACRRNRRRPRRWRRSPLRSAWRAKSNYRRPREREQPPLSSPRPKAPSSISTGCVGARRITTPPCATG